MKKVLFITSFTSDVRELNYKARRVWDVARVTDLNTAPSAISSFRYDFILFDIGLTGVYSPDLLFQITSIPRHPPVFILSREYSFEFFNLGRKAGVSGYFHIPYTLSVLVAQIDRFFEASQYLVDETLGDAVPPGIDTILLGKSSRMEQVRNQILGFRMRREPVLITGETGSGKELVARMIHKTSPVSCGVYSSMNVSCITPSLAESILFGTVKGSYTGSVDSKGLFEEADGGTLFLDEIGDLDLSLQPKFLRVLEDKAVSRLCSFKTKKVDFRLVCATNRKLQERIEEGLFRQDLYYRIDVLRLELPPLREHSEDIPQLASYRLREYKKVLSNNALEKLHYHQWPGNVRELFSCLSRAACNSGTDIIYPDQILF